MSNPRTIRAIRGLAGSLVLACSIFGFVRAAEGPEPYIRRTQPLSYYQSLVNTMLPSFGSSLITVANGPNWMNGLSVHQVAAAMQDSDPSKIETDGLLTLGYDPPDGPRFVKLDFARGYVRQANRDRSFHDSSPCTAVPTAEAENSLLGILSALNLPTQEWGFRRVDTVMERAVSGEGGDPSQETTCEIERMVTMARQATNGYPIFDSWARASISNLHQRARIWIDWPQFVMGTGLGMRSRATVVDELAQKIWEAERDLSGYGPVVDLSIRIGYEQTDAGFLPVARAAVADTGMIEAGLIQSVPLAENPTSVDAPAAAPAMAQLNARFDAEGGTALFNFYLPQGETVRLVIVDVSGREVITLADQVYGPGWHQSVWNARDRENRRVTSGVYFARLQAGGASPARRILVVH